MNGPMLVQAVVIAGIGAWALWFAFRRLLPKTYRRLLAHALDQFDRPAVPRWLRDAARRAEPTGSGGASCGDGCSSCGGCGTASGKPVGEAQPLMFRPRAKH